MATSYYTINEGGITPPFIVQLSGRPGNVVWIDSIIGRHNKFPYIEQYFFKGEATNLDMWAEIGLHINQISQKDCTVFADELHSGNASVFDCMLAVAQSTPIVKK
jgi:hypothetical protein